MLFHSSLRQELMRTFSATLVVLVTVVQEHSQKETLLVLLVLAVVAEVLLLIILLSDQDMVPQVVQVSLFLNGHNPHQQMVSLYTLTQVNSLYQQMYHKWTILLLLVVAALHLQLVVVLVVEVLVVY